MSPTDFRGWRGAMAFTQQEAADALGVSRMTITMYERGYRHDDQRPVVIPRSIELACAALWLGITEFTGDAFVTDNAPNDAGHIGLLRTSEVPERFVAAALRKLDRRGEQIGQRLTFPLKPFIGLWPEIEPWCRENLTEGSYRFRPVPMIDSPGGGVAVMAFASATAATAFKIRWC